MATRVLVERTFRITGRSAAVAGLLLEGEICPVTRKRGGSIYVVRHGAVRPVPSNRQKTEDDVHRELVAEQG